MFRGLVDIDTFCFWRELARPLSTIGNTNQINQRQLLVQQSAGTPDTSQTAHQMIASSVLQSW